MPTESAVTDTRYFEDFQLGDTWSSDPTPVSAEEIMSFGQAYDPQPMHTDPALAAAGPFGGLVASGWHIAAMSVRVFVQAGGYGKTPLVGLGIDELRWQRSVHPGDTLTFTREVAQLRRSESSPGHGIVRTLVTVRNQHAQTVMTLFTAGRVPVRPQASETRGERLMTTIVQTPAGLAAYIGLPLGSSEWVVLDQSRIDAFAALTGDDHWIHTDEERAGRELSGGKTLVHGFLTLSLIPFLQRTVFRVLQRGKGLNYGCNRVRFTSPVQVGSRVRLHQSVKACECLADGSRITFDCTIEVEGQDRPALVAETMLQIFDR